MLVNELLSNLDELVNHEYGNFIIQQVIFLKEVEFNLKIINFIKENFVALAKKKFASNVIDKVTIHFNPSVYF
jgi:hypothetical protein